MAEKFENMLCFIDLEFYSNIETEPLFLALIEI